MSESFGRYTGDTGSYKFDGFRTYVELHLDGEKIFHSPMTSSILHSYMIDDGFYDVGLRLASGDFLRVYPIKPQESDIHSGFNIYNGYRPGQPLGTVLNSVRLSFLNAKMVPFNPIKAVLQQQCFSTRQMLPSEWINSVLSGASHLYLRPGIGQNLSLVVRFIFAGISQCLEEEGKCIAKDVLTSVEFRDGIVGAYLKSILRQFSSYAGLHTDGCFGQRELLKWLNWLANRFPHEFIELAIDKQKLSIKPDSINQGLMGVLKNPLTAILTFSPIPHGVALFNKEGKILFDHHKLLAQYEEDLFREIIYMIQNEIPAWSAIPVVRKVKTNDLDFLIFIGTAGADGAAVVSSWYESAKILDMLTRDILFGFSLSGLPAKATTFNPSK